MTKENGPEMSGFKIGQLIICVDDSPCKGLQATVIKGQIYTVAEIFISQYDGKPGLVLDGVKAPGTYRGFHPYRFRPCRVTSLDELRQAVAGVRRALEREDA